MIALHWFWKDLIGVAVTGVVLFCICIVAPILLCGKDNRRAFLKEIRKDRPQPPAYGNYDNGAWIVGGKRYPAPDPRKRLPDYNPDEEFGDRG